HGALDVGVACGGNPARVEEERTRVSVEVPAWMFEPVACAGLRMMVAPVVGCAGLRALQAVLRTVPRSAAEGVVEAQHRSLPAAGGADAPVCDSPTTLATHVVSSRCLASVVSDAVARDSSQDDSIAGAAAAGAFRSAGRRRRAAGGG